MTVGLTMIDERDELEAETIALEQAAELLKRLPVSCRFIVFVYRSGSEPFGFVYSNDDDSTIDQVLDSYRTNRKPIAPERPM